MKVYNNNNIELYHGDCMDIMDELINKNVKVDLIMTDPPYLIANTNGGEKSPFAKSIRKMNTELETGILTEGINNLILEQLIKLQDKINIYIWCNHKQIPQYLDFFVNQHKCNFDIIIWNKTNAMPTFCNKYLTDKEYCLYFRKGGYCMPQNYENAKTVFHQPINIKDKKYYQHPTIKPLNIIETLIKNSTKQNDLVLDCFSGSGTTFEACQNLNRRGIGIEIEKQYCDITIKRLKTIQTRMF